MKDLKHLVKCYVCHKELLQEKVVGGKFVEILHPEHTQTEFCLNNGSRMPVVVCLSCKNNVNLDNPIIHNKIMKNVVDAWQEEQNFLLEKDFITKQQSDDCMSIHKSFSILFKSHGLDDYQVKSRMVK